MIRMLRDYLKKSLEAEYIAIEAAVIWVRAYESSAGFPDLAGTWRYHDAQSA
ncbi:MAG: hypothetical protein ACLVEJ_18585 [Parabacteroides sp.]